MEKLGLLGAELLKFHGFSVGWEHTVLCLFVSDQVTIANMYLFSFSHSSTTVLVPALRTVGNIVTGDDTQTQVLILHYQNYDQISIKTGCSSQLQTW